MRHSNPNRLFQKHPDQLPGIAKFLYDGLAPDIQNLLKYPDVPIKGDDNQKYAKLNSYAKPIVWRGMRPARTYLALILSWILILWWGERLVFLRSISACEWGEWEQWVSLPDFVSWCRSDRC